MARLHSAWYVRRMLKLAIALLVLGVAAVGSGAIARTPRVEAGSNIVWRDCYEGYECGELQVPLDYKRPGEEQIDIALIKVPALKTEERIGSLLVNFGGPGGPGVEIVLNSATFFPQEIQDRFDIIGFDPRGVGLSDDVDCVDNFNAFPELDSSPSPSQHEHQVEFWRDFARDCQRRSGKLLQFVDTNSAARDMDRIREELGDEKMTYLGFSYGSLLGQAYADLFPERVRALVIDGILDPANTTHDMLVETSVGADIALQGFLDACAANASCAFKAPNLAAAFDEVIAAAEKEPLPGWEYPITADMILQATFGAMYDHTTWIGLAETLRQAYEERSGVGFGAFIFGTELPDDEDIDFTNGFEAFSSISCVDFLSIDGEPEFQRILADATAGSPRWGAYITYAYGLPCAFWPGAPRRPAAPVIADGSAPILVVSSKYDPITRYDFGVAVANQLASGVLLSSESYGHTSHGFCTNFHTVAYLTELTLPPVGTTCANEDEPFPALIEEEPAPPAPVAPIPPPIAPIPAPPTGSITAPDTGSSGQQSSDRPGLAAVVMLSVAATALAAGARVFARGTVNTD